MTLNTPIPPPPSPPLRSCNRRLLKARYWLALLLHRRGDSTAAGKQLWEVHQRDKGFPDPAGLNTSLAAQVAEAGAMSSPALPKPAGGVEDGGGTPVVADSDDGVEAGTGGGGGGAGDSGDPGSGECRHPQAGAA